MLPCLRPASPSASGAGRIFLDIKAQPGASKTEIAGLQGNRLRLRLAAAPEDGKANAELIRFFAKLLGRAKADFFLESGEKSRLKILSLPAEELEKLEGILKNDIHVSSNGKSAV